MVRAKAINPEAYAEQLPAKLSVRELRRRVAELIRMAVVESGGAVQLTRCCKNPNCKKMMRLGGWRLDRGSNGRVDKIWCSEKCRRSFQRRRK